MDKNRVSTSTKNSFLRLGRTMLKKILSPAVLLKYKNIREYNRHECDRRRNLNIFDYHEIATPLPYAAYHITHGMNMYGFFYSFTRYAGINKINSSYGIEHGLYLASKGRKYAQVITFGNYREKHLAASSSKAIKIGPYIHYAEPLLSEHDQAILKEKVGKVLLVFPTHSINTTIASFDIQSLIKVIEQKKSNFDEVLVCMYWKDIELGRASVYEEKGYKIVTAGHSYDSYFLSRLKTIIELADEVLTNDFGTHMGYCVYMKKPLCLFSQPVKYEAGVSLKAFDKEMNQRTNEERNEMQVIKDQLQLLFASFDGSVSDEQYERMSYFFGFDYVRSREELKKLIQ